MAVWTKSDIIELLYCSLPPEGELDRLFFLFSLIISQFDISLPNTMKFYQFYQGSRWGGLTGTLICNP